ncbi:uncharacterized protein E5676_scaffold180G001240 [Cucumis melo var. makuwa]|uniref:Retrotransposon gag domain-containing protein n=1 Tax=Cucumis melo var. makuwa TaxID=1194695 RepID=A0A5D3BEQ4_CUCMM|nr:uncharacterized protein E6C27_scaffold355G00120 [Cucumis melo var. makuwa]TYJ98222.1 uncharacterized protein E5676_scaffold180G001240 [Cucumis melo var. makuwa]
MLYLVEVSDSIRYLESRLEEISEKVDTIDAVAGRVKGLLIQEFSSGFVAHMEERVNELDNSQKTLLEMINDMSKDFLATLDVVKNEVADVNTRLNLTMRVIANQALVGGAIPVSKYFKATNTVTEEANVTLAMRHLSEDAKLWWRSRYIDIQEGRCTIDTWDALKKELRSQFFFENVEILNRRKLCELKHTDQAKGEVDQIEGCEKPRIEALKYLSSLQKKARERSVLAKKGLFTGNGVPLEHHVISMPSAKCLVITGSFSTVVQADICQPNGFKMISIMQLDKSSAQEEPPSVAILLGALRKLGETIPKDTLCIPEKCRG